MITDLSSAFFELSAVFAPKKLLLSTTISRFQKVCLIKSLFLLCPTRLLIQLPDTTSRQ